MKKKGITILLAFMLLMSATGISYGASYKINDLYGGLSGFFKAYNAYVYKYLQGNGQQGNSQQSNGQQSNSQQSNSQQGSVQTGKAAEVLKLVNEERSKAGLAGLKSDDKLNKLAQLKAQDMAEKGYFSHTSPTYGSAFDMMKEYGVSYKTAGENIAKGQRTSESVMRSWMNSQGHRANILNSGYSRLGVGYAVDAKGNTYWVQMFAG